MKRRRSIKLLVVKNSITMAEHVAPPLWLYYDKYVALVSCPTTCASQWETVWWMKSNLLLPLQQVKLGDVFKICNGIIIFKYYPGLPNNICRTSLRIFKAVTMVAMGCMWTVRFLYEIISLAASYLQARWAWMVTFMKKRKKTSGVCACILYKG